MHNGLVYLNDGNHVGTCRGAGMFVDGLGHKDVDKGLYGCGRYAHEKRHLQVGDLAAEALDGELVPLLPRPTLAPLMLQQRLQGLDLPRNQSGIDCWRPAALSSQPPHRVRGSAGCKDEHYLTYSSLWTDQRRPWLAAHLGALLLGGQLEQRAALLLQRQLVPPQLGRLRRLLRLPLGLLLILLSTTCSLSQCTARWMSKRLADCTTAG